MINIQLGGKTYSLATSLRVIFALKDISGAKNMQEAINSISNLDLDGQLKFIYAAYKASKPENVISENAFIDELLDNYGIYAITNIVEQLTEGLLYSGLTKEEIDSKKTMTEAMVSQAGAISSVKGSV